MRSITQQRFLLARNYNPDEYHCNYSTSELHDGMPTEAAALSSGGGPAEAGGPATTTTAGQVANARGFWEHIAQGQRDMAAEVAASIASPLVTQFSIQEEFGTTGGLAAGTLRLQEEATTPTSVVSCWNSDKVVMLTRLDADLCLANVSKGGDPDGQDFKACGLYKRTIKLEGEGTNCSYHTHDADVPGSQVHRLEIDGAAAEVGVYAISFPLASVATKPAVFSAPLSWVSAWPSSLMAIGRHEMLLTIKVPPAVWRLSTPQNLPRGGGHRGIRPSGSWPWPGNRNSHPRSEQLSQARLNRHTSARAGGC